MLKEHLKIKPNRNGQGIFTNVNISKDSPIIEMIGNALPEHQLKEPNDSMLLQVGSNTFITPSNDIDDLINHSCDPNCYLHVMGHRAVLFALYDIMAGTELTFDYSTSSTDTLDKWQMECHCSTFKCRKVISGIQYLPDNLIEEYKLKGMIPTFILQPNLFTRK